MPLSKSSSPEMAAVQSVAAAIVTGDPELRDRVRAIVNNLLDRTEYMMKWGTEAERASLVKSFMPGMIRALQSAEASTTAQAQRTAYEQHRRDVRDALGTAHIGVVGEIT